MAIIQKTLFPENLEKYNTFVRDTDTNSKYFKITELPDTLTGGKNAFLIQGSEYLVADTLIKIEIKDSQGNIVYHEPGEGIISASVGGESIITEYYEGVSKVVAVYVYPDTTFGPATITILGEVSSYDNNGLLTPIPLDWEGKYNVKWQRQVNVNPALANTTKIRFYRRPAASISEILNPIYSFVGDTKVASAVTQSFANIKLSNLETFAGDVKRVKVFRTSIGDISDYDLIQDILVESKELLTTDELTGSVVGNTGIFTSEVLKTQWNTGSLNAFLTSSRVEAGVRLTGSGLFTYTQSLDLKSTNTYELNLDAFYSSSTSSNLGIYLVSGSTSSSIATLAGTQPTKNLLDTTIPFKIDRDFPTAFLYFSQSQGEWHLGNISLKLSQDTAFSPDEIRFITTMPTVLGNETFNFKFEFYDINNNYVPVEVTQSATFTGGNTNIGGTITLINSSSAVLEASILTLSGSVSTSVQSLTGSITDKSSSFNNSVILLTGSITTVSASVNTLSSSVSQSISLSLSSSLSKVKQLADGGFTGTFIDGTTVFSPVIGGVDGYFSGKFQVGAAPNPIVLDAQTSTRKIYIGTGTYGNSNTSVYLDSTGKFSLGNKLSYDGSNLSVNGSITITNPSTANNGGAIGSFSNGDALTGGSIAGLTLTSTKIHLGTGTHGNSNTGFYVDNTGKFSLKDKLVWDGTTLSIEGNIVITGGSTKTSIDNAASAASTAQTTADSKITGGQVNANVTSISGGTITTGTVAANRIDVAGVISAGGIIVTGGAATDVNNNVTNISGGKIRTGKIQSNNFSGTDDGSGFATEGTSIDLTGGGISAKNFRITAAGGAFFKGDITGASGTFSGTLQIGGTNLTAANTLNTQANIELGLGYTPTTAAAAATAANSAAKTGGSVGGWTITSTEIQGGSPSGGGDGSYTSQGIRLGAGGYISAKNFYIDTSGNAAFKGNLTATGGSFTGDVTAGSVTIGTSGISFGSFRIDGSGIGFPDGVFGRGFSSLVYDYSMFTQRIRLYQNDQNQGGHGDSLQFDYIEPVSSGTVSMQIGTNGRVKKASSSRRYKKNIEDTTLDEAKRILNLNVRSFNGLSQSDDEDKVIGLVAEEVIDLGYADLVVLGESGSVESVYYQSVFSSMVKVVQDLNNRIEQLEARLSGSI